MLSLLLAALAPRAALGRGPEVRAQADEIQKLTLRAVPLAKATVPDETIEPLIPKPKMAKLDYVHPRELTGVFAFPAGRFRYWDDFKSGLARRFVIPVPPKTAAAVNVDGGVSRLEFRPGGYTINVDEKGISVLGEQDEGLRNGLYRLAQLVYAKGGKLWVPSGRLEDEPQIQYRGVHLFVGPEARDFQRKLWERVLLPLGMNNVVLQCERTNWKSTPVEPGEHPMSREELAGLFADYRKWDIEPTPLIQSFGHMEWFFRGGKRLELAYNQDEPYTIDPRKPGSKQALVDLWTEAAELLKPKAFHFGCDEVDMLGFGAKNPELVTELWQAQMPILGDIAKSRGAKMMIWGDKALGPGEAIDAALGDTRIEAAKRRRAIPAGTTIFDWHYQGDPRPEKFYPTLQLWKREGFTPIAAAWYRPDNVRGFDVAATLERVGTLQTTWAGFQSSEKGMVDALPQFSAMVLAADYSWSGRSDAVESLPYDPSEVFRKMYFGEPSYLTSRAGQSLVWDAGTSQRMVVGGTAFLASKPLAMRAAMDESRATAPTSFSFQVAGKGSRLVLALNTSKQLTDGDPVADVEVRLASGKKVTRRLVYGHHVRSDGDLGAVPYAERSKGVCSVVVSLGSAASISQIDIRELNRSAGVRIFGLTVL